MSINSNKRIGAKEWAAVAAVGLPEYPPYLPNMPVTSLSVYADDEWEFPKVDLPPGGRLPRFLRFFAPIKGSGIIEVMRLTGSDEVLVRELKECMVAMMFRQSVLTHKRKLTVPKPASVVHFFIYARRIFIAVKFAGYASISDVPVNFPSELLDRYTSTDSEYNKLITVFGTILTFLECRLVSSEIMNKKFHLELRDVPLDTTREIGAQALDDKELAIALNASRFYIDNFEEIIDVVHQFDKRNLDSARLAARLSEMLPVREPLQARGIRTVAFALIKIAAYNFIGWHLGARISEVLSARRGFITHNNEVALLAVDAVDLQLETRKSIKALHGEARVFAVHPYLARVGHILEKLKDYQGGETEFLFEGPVTRDIIETNGFNEILRRFARLHGYRDDISSHTWRNTLVSVTVRAVAEPLGPLAHLLGHEHVSTVVAYAFSNPFVRREMRRALSKAMSPHVDRFLDSSRHFNGPGLGGRQGLAIELDLDRRLARGENLLDARANIAAHLKGGEMSMARVDDGIDCIKAPLTKGYCTHGNGDILADTEQCNADCMFRAESAPARERLQTEIANLSVNFLDAGTSSLMKMRRAADIIDSLKSWPTLVPDLIEALDSSPDLWKFFEELDK